MPLLIALEHFVFPSPCSSLYTVPLLNSPVAFTLPVQPPHLPLSPSLHSYLRNTHLLVSWTQPALSLLWAFRCWSRPSGKPFSSWSWLLMAISQAESHRGGSKTMPGPLRSTQGAISSSSANLEQSLNCTHAMVAVVTVKAF